MCGNFSALRMFKWLLFTHKHTLPSRFSGHISRLSINTPVSTLLYSIIIACICLRSFEEARLLVGPIKWQKNGSLKCPWSQTRIGTRTIQNSRCAACKWREAWLWDDPEICFSYFYLSERNTRHDTGNCNVCIELVDKNLEIRVVSM